MYEMHTFTSLHLHLNYSAIFKIMGKINIFIQQYPVIKDFFFLIDDRGKYYHYCFMDTETEAQRCCVSS